MPLRVRLAHVTDGRARLRIAERLEPAAYAELADRFAAEPLVERVVVRPNTGSVILEAQADKGVLEDSLKACAWLTILPPAHTPPVGQVAQFGLFKLDSEIRNRTHETLDFRSALAMLLFTAAIFQASRGRIAGPATTLAVSALAILEKSKPGMFTLGGLADPTED